jgi:hypothetical protein
MNRDDVLPRGSYKTNLAELGFLEKICQNLLGAATEKVFKPTLNNMTLEYH